MASFEYDTVKAEKARAIRRYNLKRTCSLCLCLAPPLGLLLYCCFWSFPYFPAIKDSPSAYLSILGKKFYVFLLANLLGLAVWYLSTVPPAAAPKSETYEPSHGAPQPVELYDQYAPSSSAACSSRRCRSLSPAPIKETQLVIALPPVESKSTPFLKEEDDENADDPPPVEENVNERRELIRSKTETGMSAWTGGSKKRLKSLEEMSNEEFRLTVDGLIALQHKLWADENAAPQGRKRSNFGLN